MNALQQAIDALIENSDIQDLKLASQKITDAYRQGGTLTSVEEFLAYLIVRLPATYAAITEVLKNIPPPKSILDIGAGPGTLFWAAQSTWETHPLITALEREPGFIELGKKLGSQVNWKSGDALTTLPFETHDWVFFGYSLGELPEQARPALLDKCWQAARQGIVIVEPGTPRGNQNMLQARSHLINLGGSVWAPCPHSLACPMKAPGWCHFSVRLDRSRLHRHAKIASLSYEDEKYSYVVIAKTPPHHYLSRIIHSPAHRSGHTLLPLCTPRGLETLTISRRHKELYRQARKSSWGDPFPDVNQELILH